MSTIETGLRPARVTIEAVVIRADGSKEDLGVVVDTVQDLDESKFKEVFKWLQRRRSS